MEDGLLSLKWNNHKITFCEILRTLREKSNYTDATIAVEGKFYPVHKLVLSTCSEYFEDIFARTPCKSPVIVLKDVRSQDMDALLDYMYLGEVNVNQNDLASLLKTAECLRIRGLAVPDDENTKSKKAPLDERHDSPPPKRRRHDDASRPVSPPASTNTKTPTPLPSPVQPPSAIGSQSSPDHIDSDPPPHIVKVEMQEHDQEDGFRQENYEGSVNEEGGGEFGGEVSKSEHDPESYGSSSFPGPSLQPGGDLAWEEGDSSSFPPETFSSDVPAGQQPQGEPLDGYRCHCHVCGKGFYQPYNLRRHLRTHTGERPFACSFCPYAASEKSHLKAHVARKHRNSCPRGLLPPARTRDDPDPDYWLPPSQLYSTRTYKPAEF